MHHFEYHSYRGPSHQLYFICIMASKEPLSVARQLLVARLGGITSLNNSEVTTF